MNKIKTFIKKETVLSIAWLLALISAFFVPPSRSYIDYIDFRSLGILWALMVITGGLSANGVFENIGNALLSMTRKVWQLSAVLIGLCFFFSMIITNDVALITFVPFAIYLLCSCKKEELLIPVIALQTLAANLGSMLTPVGNPQNLYLYGISGMGMMEFLSLMFPLTAATFFLLMISIFLLKGKNDPIIRTETSEHTAKGNSGKIILYAVLFIAALLVVARVLSFEILVLLVLVIVFIIDRSVLFHVDYALLFTFIGFFVFTGNLGNLPAVSRILTSLVNGKEVITGVLSSQVISNVPAALLLSTFTDHYRELIIGVNLGGLGTLIASMASLISFKALSTAYSDKKGAYFRFFTISNIIYLILLLLFYYAFY